MYRRDAILHAKAMKRTSTMRRRRMNSTGIMGCPVRYEQDNMRWRYAYIFLKTEQIQEIVMANRENVERSVNVLREVTFSDGSDDTISVVLPYCTNENGVSCLSC